VEERKRTLGREKESEKEDEGDAERRFNNTRGEEKAE
jgi:hypothetical protein